MNPIEFSLTRKPLRAPLHIHAHQWAGWSTPPQGQESSPSDKGLARQGSRVSEEQDGSSTGRGLYCPMYRECTPGRLRRFCSPFPPCLLEPACCVVGLLALACPGEREGCHWVCSVYWPKSLRTSGARAHPPLDTYLTRLMSIAPSPYTCT